MELISDTSDLVALKQTLEYFKKLEFSDRYVEQIEQELLQHEEKLAKILDTDDS